MSPETEKEGLLLPARPWEDGAPTRADVPNRRPADVWLPRGGGRSAGRPEAIDFAVTCGIRPSRVSLACRAPEDVLQEYTEYKNNHNDTAAECQRQGFLFTPFIVEAHGGSWCPDARRLADFTARQQVAAGMWAKEGLPLRLAQRISCTIQVQNARAMLRRLAQPKWSSSEDDLEAVDAAVDEET